jgi:NAD(P)-dependent dehydrogenase (short-subunit alcohol dehydrogenase family)
VQFDLPHVSTDLSGQVALLTGASSGLGRRFAEVLAAAGASVAVTARRMTQLETLAAEIRARGGVAEPIQLDVRDRASIVAGVAEAERRLGTVTILVNNAGFGETPPAIEMSAESIDAMIETNLRAPYLLSVEVIVNITSIAVYQSLPNSTSSLYGATKTGLLRLTEGLAMEWARHRINVNAIAPGLFHSEMSDKNMTPALMERVKRFPRGRIGEAPQLDSTLLFLVSPASEFVTGAQIVVDDGQMGR